MALDIRVTDLVKNYGAPNNALDGVTFSLPQGEVFGLLGPNGAGKTTMVKLLCGMLAPTKGSMRVLGIDPVSSPERVHGIAGVLTETARMYGHMTAMENLVFFGGMFGISKRESVARAEELLRILDLTSDRDKKAEAFSTGMHQRLSLARALLHRPKALFLDEPTAGLDPQNAAIVNDLVQKLAREDGVTVFLCTHQLRYAEGMCTSFGLLDRGRMLALGTLQELRDATRPGLVLSVRGEGDFGGTGFRKVRSGFYEADVGGEGEIPALVRRLVRQGVSIYEVSARHPSLEEIYFELVRREERAEDRNPQGGGIGHA